MANANFYLKKPKAKTETPIVLVFRYNGQTLKYSTGEKVHPKFWNEENQRTKKSLTGSTELNAYLADIENAVGRIYSNQFNANRIIPTPEYIRQKLKEEFKKSPKKNTSFFSVFELFNEQSKTTKQESTIKKYRTCLTLLREFSQKRKVNISFEMMDANFCERFIKFLIEERNHTNNTIGKYIQLLKTFLLYATANGYNNKVDFIKQFKVMKEETAIIYLTQEELKILAEKDFSGDPRLERVQDLFLFGCYTGLRFSDIQKLKSENIKKDFISIQAQKTKANISVPLSPLAKQILKKYDNSLPNVITNQKMNDYLKEVCKDAEIDEPTQTIKHRGAMRADTTLPKYKLIGTHTARRTFITLSLEKGMRAETIMEITGHKKYDTFKRYISITNKVKQNEINRVWGIEPKLKAV